MDKKWMSNYEFIHKQWIRRWIENFHPLWMKSECLWMNFIHEWHVKEIKNLTQIINY
jgi:hypothetical protein